MLACLRSAQFYYPDWSSGVVIELRRHHDLNAQCGNKEFLVTRRLTQLSIILTKAFGTYNEASRYWDEHVAKLTDQGLARRDAKIIGFHEEG